MTLKFLVVGRNKSDMHCVVTDCRGHPVTDSLRKINNLGKVAHTFNSSTAEAEAGESLNSRIVGYYIERLCIQNKKKKTQPS